MLFIEILIGTFYVFQDDIWQIAEQPVKKTRLFSNE